MTKLLDLPDEILEIAIDHLLQSIDSEHDNVIAHQHDQGSHRLCFSRAHPSFPRRPYGCSLVAPVRLVCGRLATIVDACLFRKAHMTLYTAPPPVPPVAYDSWSYHAQCQSVETSSDAFSKPCWQILHNSTQGQRIRHLTLETCYTGAEMNRVAGLSKIHNCVRHVIGYLAPNITSLLITARLDDWCIETGLISARLPCIMRLEPTSFPALRRLSIGDLPSLPDLPYIIYNAKSLESVSVVFWKFEEEPYDYPIEKACSELEEYFIQMSSKYGNLGASMPLKLLEMVNDWDQLAPRLLPHLNLEAEVIRIEVHDRHIASAEEWHILVALASKASAGFQCKLLKFDQTRSGLPGSQRDSKVREQVSAAIREEWRNTNTQAVIRWDVHVDHKSRVISEYY